LSDAMLNEHMVRRMSSLVLLTCGVVTSLTIAALAKPEIERRLGWQPREAHSYRPDDVIDLPSALYAHADRTVLVFVRSGCGACRRAKPDLMAVVAAARSRNVPVVAVTSPSFRKEELAFAADLGIDAEQVHVTDLTKLRLKVVPAVVVIDRRGRVITSRETTSVLEQTRSILGALTQAQQE